MAVATLTTVRRQKDPELKKVVELAYAGRIPEAVDCLIAQHRITEIPNAAERYERIAALYLQSREARQSCLVVSPANDERKELNRVIRETLVAHKYVNSLGQEHQILLPRNFTPEELQNARSYRENDVVQFIRGSKKHGIPKSYLIVHAVSDDRLTLRAENGRLIRFDPAGWKGIRVYTSETRTIAAGDPLQWREPDGKRRIPNGHYGTITKLDARNIEVRFDKNNRTVSMPIGEARKVDLGYAVTSHSSQGSTVHRVLTNIDPSHQVNLVNDRQFYVSHSRPEYDAMIFTTSIDKMRQAVSRTQEKELALDVVQKPRQSARIRI
jgi:ATP-dependent exoDNAse (exonuclease V) alpha subunit